MLAAPTAAWCNTVIYFIREVRYKRSPVKIGYSGGGKKGCIARLHGLQIGNPRRLGIVALLKGSIEREQALHAKFEQYRINGEWFWWGRRIREFLEGTNSWLTKPLVFSSFYEKKEAKRPKKWAIVKPKNAWNFD